MAILAWPMVNDARVVQDSNADEPCSTNANPLDQLRIFTCRNPSLVALAPGWWLLIIIALALMVWATRFYRRYKAGLYRRRIEKLDQLTELNNQQQLTQLYELLKQTANSAYPRLRPASLGTEAFVHFWPVAVAKRFFSSWISIWRRRYTATQDRGFHPAAMNSWSGC